MTKNRPISLDDLKAFDNYLRKGHKQSVAAKLAGRSLKALLNAVNTFNFELYRRHDARYKPVYEYLDDYVEGRMTTNQISEVSGIKLCTVRSALKKKLGSKYRSIMDQFDLVYNKPVVDYIKKNGGSLNKALEALNQLPGRHSSVKGYAERKGINLSHYFHSNKETGCWTIIPTAAKWSKEVGSTRLVSAKCNRCGEVKEVSLYIVMHGSTFGCQECIDKHREKVKIRNVDTGKKYYGYDAFVKAFNLTDEEIKEIKEKREKLITVKGNTFRVSRIYKKSCYIKVKDRQENEPTSSKS